MWVLVVAEAHDRLREDCAAAVLSQLGCRTETIDLQRPDVSTLLSSAPPTVVLVEALGEVDAGVRALDALRQRPGLADVPVVCAVSVAGMSRLQAQGPFDDFVLFPYVPAELLLRLRAVEWRRSDFSGPERIKTGRLLIDRAAHEVTVANRSVELTVREFALLQFLASHRGRVFTRDQLLERVWGVEQGGGTRTVDIHVRRLRAKLGHEAGSLQTVRGVGYKWGEP